MLLATIFPETLEQPLPQTIEDVEKMGLSWYVHEKSSFHCLSFVLLIVHSVHHRRENELYISMDMIMVEKILS